MSDHAEHLYQIGTGWLGWSDQQTMRTSIHRIVIAHEGRMRLLEWQSPPFSKARHKARELEKNPPPPPDDVAAKLRKAFAFFSDSQR